MLRKSGYDGGPSVISLLFHFILNIPNILKGEVAAVAKQHPVAKLTYVLCRRCVAQNPARIWNVGSGIPEILSHDLAIQFHLSVSLHYVV